MPDDDDFATIWLEETTTKRNDQWGRVEEARQGSNLLQHRALESRQLHGMRQASKFKCHCSWCFLSARHDGRRRSVWFIHCWKLLLSAMAIQCTLQAIIWLVDGLFFIRFNNNSVTAYFWGQPVQIGTKLSNSRSRHISLGICPIHNVT